jgi:hypothetical protein
MKYTILPLALVLSLASPALAATPSVSNPALSTNTDRRTPTPRPSPTLDAARICASYTSQIAAAKRTSSSTIDGIVSRTDQAVVSLERQLAQIRESLNRRRDQRREQIEQMVIRTYADGSKSEREKSAIYNYQIRLASIEVVRANGLSESAGRMTSDQIRLTRELGNAQKVSAEQYATWWIAELERAFAECTQQPAQAARIRTELSDRVSAKRREQSSAVQQERTRNNDRRNQVRQQYQDSTRQANTILTTATNEARRQYNEQIAVIRREEAGQ